jgi:HD domain
MPARLRLADLLAGLSVASDLGFGLPPETAMRSCLLATGLARKLDLSEDEVGNTFYASLLFHVGCPAYSHETAALFGNELTILGAVAKTNVADPGDFATTLIPEATRGLAPGSRDELAGRIVRHGPTFGRLFEIASCEVASAVARRVGLGDGVQRALAEVGERWDGNGVPRGLKEDAISCPARIARATADAAVLEDLGGAEVAAAGLRARAGSLLDPAVVEAFATHAQELVTDARAGDPRARLLELEPAPVGERTEEQLRDIAAAFGHVADLKLPALHGHSAGVASLAAGAARRLRLDARSMAALARLPRCCTTSDAWQ